MEKVTICKASNKRMLYTICGILLCILEEIQRTQTGVWYVPAVNCVGLVMMIIIFSRIPVKKLLNPVNYFYSAFCIILLAAIRIHWQYHMGQYMLWQYVTAIFNAWWIGLMWHYLIDAGQFKRIEIKKNSLTVLWFLLTFLSLMGKSGLKWPVWFLFMFGGFYLSEFTREETEELWDGLADGAILSFLALTVFAFLFRPYVEVQYSWSFINCNDAAQFMLIITILALYRAYSIYTKKKHVIFVLLYGLVAAEAIAILTLTISKTGYITFAILVVCAYFFMVFGPLKDKWYKAFLKLCLFGLATVVMVPIVYAGFRFIPQRVGHRYYFFGEFINGTSNYWDVRDDSNYVKFNQLLESIGFRFVGDTYENHEEEKEAENQTEEAEYDNPYKDMDGYVLIDTENPPFAWIPRPVNLRLQIFKAYLEHSSWFGETSGDYIFYRSEGETKVWHAQNLWVQITYDFGYIAGALMCIITVLISIRNTITLRKGMAPINVLPFAVALLFFVFGITEIVWTPRYLILILFFLTQHPGLHKQINQQTSL